MSYDYGKARATAIKLIAKFGTAGVLRRTTDIGTSYDPTQATTDYLCQLVTLEYDLADTNGTTIRQTDRLIYLSVSGMPDDIAASDTIIAEGQEYSIVNVSPLSPGGTVVFYQIQARK